MILKRVAKMMIKLSGYLMAAIVLCVLLPFFKDED
nr:MAG TPA: hypothetical protein [Caudoviricetes sp.]